MGDSHKKGYLLFAFIGQQRAWDATWASQSAYFAREVPPEYEWGSFGCLDTHDHGPSQEGIRALHVSRISRTMTSAWWGSDDDPADAFFCELGRSGGKMGDWVSRDTNEGDAYYFNKRTGKSTWTMPVEMYPSFKASPKIPRMGHTPRRSSTNVSGVNAACFLRRLTACRAKLLNQCERKRCTAIFFMRPDLEIANSSEPGLLARLLATVGTADEAIYARRRCVGAGEPPRTMVHPAELCDGPAPSTRMTARSEPCPRGRYSLDDQAAFVPRRLVKEYFRVSFFPPTQADRAIDGETVACPFTYNWPEGILTNTLFQSGVPVKELRGFSTISRSSRHKKKGQVVAEVDFTLQT